MCYLDLFARVQLHVVSEKYVLTAAPEFKQVGLFVNTHEGVFFFLVDGEIDVFCETGSISVER